MALQLVIGNKNYSSWSLRPWLVLRFQTYAVPLSGAALDYANTILALPALGEWAAAARVESERIAKFDLYG